MWNYLWARVNGEFKIIEVFQADFGKAWDVSMELIKNISGVEYWDVSTSYDSEIHAWKTAKLHQEL